MARVILAMCTSCAAPALDGYSVTDPPDCERDEVIHAMREGLAAPETSRRRDPWRDYCLYPNALLQTAAARECRAKWQGEAVRLTKQGSSYHEA